MRRILVLALILATPAGSVAQDQSAIDSLRQLMRNASSDSIRVLLQVEIARQFVRNFPDSAILEANDALALSKEIGFKGGSGRALDAIGQGFWMKSNHSEALFHYEQALPLLEESKDEEGYGLCLNDIGIIYHYQTDYVLALEYFRKSVAVFRKINNQEGLAQVFNNMGLNFEAQGDPRLAMLYYQRSLKMNEASNSQQGIGQSLTNIGYIHLSDSNHAAALESLERAAAIQESIQDRSTLISSLVGMAEVYLRQKQFDKCILMAERAYQMARSMNSLMDMREATEVLYKTYKAKQSSSKALLYFERYKELTDSIFGVENNKIIATLESRLVLRQQQKEIEALEKEKRLQQQISYLVIAMLVGTLGVSLILLRNRRRLQAAYKELESTNNKLVEVKREVEVQAEMLGRSNKTKDKIFSIVSHDLRSPMTALKGLFALIESDHLTFEEFRSLVPDLSKRVSHASDIMDELLQWSKSQMDNLTLHPTLFEIRPMIVAKISEYSEQSRDKGVIIAAGSIPDKKVYADIDMVKSVLRNLISNAIKFCREGDSIAVEAAVDGAFMRITVSDTGIGISEENLPRIFSEHGFSTYGTAYEKGTGIGLMLCREFIVRNGGQIWVVSKPGQGTQFHFTLPLAT